MIIQSKSSDIFSGIYNITSPSTSVKLAQAHAHTQTEKNTSHNHCSCSLSTHVSYSLEYVVQTWWHTIICTKQLQV